jgi:uncharacterized protein YrrD
MGMEMEMLFSNRNLMNEGEYLAFIEKVDGVFNARGLRYGFLEIEDGGWQKQHEMTSLFEVTGQKIIKKICKDENTILDVFMDGNLLKFKSYFDNESGCATITLHDEKSYKKIEKLVFK